MFDGPFHLSIKEESLPSPTTGQLLGRTAFSAVSSGTELLIYIRTAFSEASRLITHRIPIEWAHEAYDLSDTKPQDVIQILFTY